VLRSALRRRNLLAVLATVAGNVLRGSRPLEALMERLRETFSLTSVSLLQRRAGFSARPDQRQDRRQGGQRQMQYRQIQSQQDGRQGQQRQSDPFADARRLFTNISTWGYRERLSARDQDGLLFQWV
jgi:hypothetical protein